MVAKDIMSKKFETVLRGFKAEEVEEFLREVSLDFSRLQKENEDLEKKLEVLANKIREYRDDEDALKDALLGAQRQGNALIADSKRKASEIIESAQKDADQIIKQAEEGRQDLKEKGEKEIAEAEEKARQIIESANQKAKQIEDEMNRKTDIQKEILHRTQTEITEFKKRVLNSYKHHIDEIERIERECANDFIDEIEIEYAESGKSRFLKSEAGKARPEPPAASVPETAGGEEILSAISKEATSELADNPGQGDGGIKINENTIKFEIDMNKGYNDETIEMKIDTPPAFKEKTSDTNEIFFDKRKNNGRSKPLRNFGNNNNNN